MDRPTNPEPEPGGRLSRRRFLKYTTAAGALTAASPALPALA